MLPLIAANDFHPKSRIHKIPNHHRSATKDALLPSRNHAVDMAIKNVESLEGVEVSLACVKHSKVV